MRFDHPALLAVGLLVAAGLAWASVTVGRRRAAALASAGVAAAGSTRARHVGVWLTVAGIAALAVAGAGPSVTVPVSHADGTVILAVDVSGSMSATDVAPSRLGAAKTAAQAFINAQPGNVEIGVVAFEDSGLEASVPSTDHATALAAVGRLSTGGGTSLGSAILAALSAITHRAVTLDASGNAPDIGDWPSATIVLFSDGQDAGTALTAGNGTGNTGPGASAGGGAAVTNAAAAAAQKAEVHVDTVGVGTTAGTTVTADGYHLFTALDEGTLKSIAQATGGTYHPASNASELNGIASSINLRLTVTNQPLPLAGAVIALAVLFLAGGTALSLVRTGRVI
jgi:Ca-activated chloride channel homolog